MKKLIDLILANRYAYAFIHTYPCVLTQEVRHNLKQLYLYLNKKKSALSVNDLFLFDESYQSAVIKTCLDQDTANAWPIQKLFALLFINRRLSLLPLVLIQIEKILMQQQKMLDLTIESSHELSPEEKEILINFFVRKTGCRTESSFIINKSLIAGIRLSSATFLWEQSLAKRLRKLSVALTQ